MNNVNPVDEKRVYDVAPMMKAVLDESKLNEHEKIVLLQNLLAHEMNMLERKNHAYLMLNAANGFNK